MEYIIIDIPSDHITIDVYDEDTLTFITYMHKRFNRSLFMRQRTASLTYVRPVIRSLSLASLGDNSVF